MAKHLQDEEQLQYAGFCCLAVARCEQTLANPSGEIAALVKGARLFLQAENRNFSLRCPSFDEHLQAAINCYNYAIRLHEEQKQYALAAALCLELGNALKNLGRTAEAVSEYQRAAELQSQSPLNYLNTLGLVASCRIELGM